MTTGKVKWYNEIKGWGFIEQDDGPDVFVHNSNITDAYKSLIDGEQVSFDIRKSERGLSAENVVCI